MYVIRGLRSDSNDDRQETKGGETRQIRQSNGSRRMAHELRICRNESRRGGNTSGRRDEDFHANHVVFSRVKNPTIQSSAFIIVSCVFSAAKTTKESGSDAISEKIDGILEIQDGLLKYFSRPNSSAGKL